MSDQELGSKLPRFVVERSADGQRVLLVCPGEHGLPSPLVALNPAEASELAKQILAQARAALTEVLGKEAEEAEAACPVCCDSGCDGPPTNPEYPYPPEIPGVGATWQSKIAWSHQDDPKSFGKPQVGEITREGLGRILAAIAEPRSLPSGPEFVKLPSGAVFQVGFVGTVSAEKIGGDWNVWTTGGSRIAISDEDHAALLRALGV